MLVLLKHRRLTFLIKENMCPIGTRIKTEKIRCVLEFNQSQWLKTIC